MKEVTFSLAPYEQLLDMTQTNPVHNSIIVRNKCFSVNRRKSLEQIYLTSEEEEVSYTLAQHKDCYSMALSKAIQQIKKRKKKNHSETLI